jgi:hypothetical protein
VKVALAVTLGSQGLVAVHVTVTAPPHIDGAAAGALLVTASVHPPLLVTLLTRLHMLHRFVPATDSCCCKVSRCS